MSNKAYDACLTLRTRGDVTVMRDSHIPLRFRLWVVDRPCDVASSRCFSRSRTRQRVQGHSSLTLQVWIKNLGIWEFTPGLIDDNQPELELDSTCTWKPALVHPVSAYSRHLSHRFKQALKHPTTYHRKSESLLLPTVLTKQTEGKCLVDLNWNRFIVTCLNQDVSTFATFSGIQITIWTCWTIFVDLTTVRNVLGTHSTRVTPPKRITNRCPTAKTVGTVGFLKTLRFRVKSSPIHW